MKVRILAAIVVCSSSCGGSCGAPTPPALPDVSFSTAAEHPRAALLSVGGTGPGDVWLVGAQPSPAGPPLVLHGDGSSWTAVDTGQRHALWWVHAFDDGRAYLGGDGATLLRIDDERVTRLHTPGFAGQTVFGVWGSAPDDMWAVGGFAGRSGFAWRTDGATVRDEPLPLDLPRSADGEPAALFKVWGRSSDDVWLVGSVGTVLHWDGAAFHIVASGTTDTLFTVTGDDDEVVIVGGGAAGVVLRGDVDGLVDDTPPGAPLLQGVAKDGDGNVWVAGAGGYAAGAPPGGAWQQVDVDGADNVASIHALWHDGKDGLWAVGGNVLTPALDAGVAVTTSTLVPSTYRPADPPPPSTSCPADAVDPVPEGSIARRWREQLLNAIRRDVPHPPVQARNIFHTSVAIWDAWAAYDPIARGVVVDEDAVVDGAVDIDEARRVAISTAAYRVLHHRFAHAQNSAVTLACFDDFMATLGLDPDDDHATGDDAVAVGNRIGQAVIDHGLNDGCNEQNGYADTTGWAPTNPVLVVDRPGTRLDDPHTWQQLNLARAETQNGIVLDTTVQPYLGAQWRNALPFALSRDPDTGLYANPGPAPDVDDDAIVNEVVEVLRLGAALDASDGETIDISPAVRGNNPLGTNDGHGHALNPATGLPYASNVVRRGDFERVVAEMWADGPKSETPPGHWLTIADDVADARAARGEPFVPWGQGAPVDRLTWDCLAGLVVSGATHDAAIAAWELKRASLGPRPISLVRYYAGKGQRTDPSLPHYSPEGLPLVPGLIELITEESSAPGQRHFALRHFVGELAVRGWPGEPGDRVHEHTPVQWMRALEWIPYQRRTFVTPAFPGFVSGHSTFSHAAAEALTALTGTPFFPGGSHEFVAKADDYLVFEQGPSTDVRLQWATYQDAADQAGQSRLYGGIHIFADDRAGRIVGHDAGRGAAARARELFEGR